MERENNGKVAVIGDRESVMLFRVIGLHTVTADTAEEAARIIHALARENYGIIYITERLARARARGTGAIPREDIAGDHTDTGQRRYRRFRCRADQKQYI